MEVRVECGFRGPTTTEVSEERGLQRTTVRGLGEGERLRKRQE